MSRPLFLFFCFCCLSTAHAQELAGIWKGTLTLSPGGCFSVYNLELQINFKGEQLSGVSYHYSDITNYVKEEFDGNYNATNKLLTISEMKVITFHVPPDCVPCIKKYELVYTKNEGTETLSGSMGGTMANNAGSCPPGKIVLTRAKVSAFKKNELVRELKVDTGNIRLDFYDNGVVDGDTISVFVNDQVIVSNKGLTTKPISINVAIDFNRLQQEVVMVAQNLGSIPPNTALMIVTAGDKRYQLYLTSDEQKNAMVRFVYEKPK